jgi:spermidine synthase
VVDDAAKFVSQPDHEFYDVIIVDSSDPVGRSSKPTPALRFALP